MTGKVGADVEELKNYYDAVEPLTEDLAGKVGDLKTAVSALGDYAGEFSIDLSNIQSFDLADDYYVGNVESLVTEIKETDKIALDAANRIHTVDSGDNLWTIAEQQLIDAHGDDPDYEPKPQDIYDYWVDLVAANEENLRSGNPDLIHADEELYLPPVPGPSDSPGEEEDFTESSDDNLEDDSDSEITPTTNTVPEGPPGPDGTIMGQELPADDPRNTEAGTGDDNLILTSGSEPPDGDDAITQANILWAGQQTEMTSELRHWLLQQTSSNDLSADTKAWLADILNSGREIVVGGQPVLTDERISFSHLLQTIISDQRPATFTAG